MPGLIRLWNSSLLSLSLIQGAYTFQLAEWEFGGISPPWRYRVLGTAPLLILLAPGVSCTAVQSSSVVFYNLISSQNGLHSFFPLESTEFDIQKWQPTKFKQKNNKKPPLHWSPLASLAHQALSWSVLYIASSAQEQEPFLVFYGMKQCAGT